MVKSSPCDRASSTPELDRPGFTLLAHNRTLTPDPKYIGMTSAAPALAKDALHEDYLAPPAIRTGQTLIVCLQHLGARTRVFVLALQALASASWIIWGRAAYEYLFVQS